MHIDDMTPSKYLKRSDVEPPKIVTISDLKQENLARDNEAKKMRWTMSFEELDKPLVLNKTNLKRTAKALNTEETDEWIGKKIMLYFDEEVEFGGEQVGGIRVTSAKRKPAPAPVAQGVDESDPPWLDKK